MYIQDRDTLQNLAQEYFEQEQEQEQEQVKSYQSFFKALESTYISDLIHEVRIKVKVKNVDGSLTFRELSEGEQQLLMVLGLMRFTKEEESLFLLDEPDTHLNPAWSVKYLDFIQGEHNIVGLRENSQVLITTHNPMTLAGLKASQVQIVHRKESDGHIYAEPAMYDPKGMGFAGILTSDIFGLRSTLDNETLGKLDRQRSLVIQSIHETLSDNEQEELQQLKQELEDIGVIGNVRDPYYALFVKSMKHYEIEHQEFQKRTLTKEEIKKRNQIALKILNDIRTSEKGGT